MNNNDELQVLGRSRRLSKREKWLIVFIGTAMLCAVVLLGVWGHQVFGNDKADMQKETTIIPELQQAVDSLLNDELEVIGGLQGQVIVMEVQTGEILAMAGRERRFDGKFQPCVNFGYQQEPGSAMQTAALLALLETGEVELTDEVETGNGVWAVDKEREMIDHNWRRGGYGKITLQRALEVSSNIAISKTVQKVFKGQELRYYELLDEMGFGQPARIDGIEELSPQRYSSPKDSIWASRMMLWNSIGYERLMSPIQTLTFYNAIANDGKMVKPTLRPGTVEVINPQIASKENVSQIQMALERVVSRGLGKKAGIYLMAVAGKTGTAQVNVVDEDDAINTIGEYHISFCGYFPANAAKYSIMVSLNKQGLPASGGGMAGVVFHNIVEWMIDHDMPHVIIRE